jgi:hypothetical protein
MPSRRSRTCSAAQSPMEEQSVGLGISPRYIANLCHAASSSSLGIRVRAARVRFEDLLLISDDGWETLT